MSQYPACMNQWDSAAESIYATNGFVMRVLTPIALLLVIATVTGCCHRRAASLYGSNSCRNSIHRCETCCSNAVAANTLHGRQVFQPALDPLVAPLAPQEISTAPPLPATTLRSPVVGEILDNSSTNEKNETNADFDFIPAPPTPSTPPAAAPISPPSPTNPPTTTSRRQPIRLNELPTPAPLVRAIEVPQESPLSFIEKLPNKPEIDSSTAKTSDLNLLGGLTLAQPEEPLALKPVTLKTAPTPIEEIQTEESTQADPPISIDLATEDQSTNGAPLLSLNRIEDLPAATAIETDVATKLTVGSLATVPTIASTVQPAPSDASSNFSNANAPLVLRATTYLTSARNTRRPNSNDQQSAVHQDNDPTSQITEATQLDPVYGLPLNDQVNFVRLPKLASEATSEQQKPVVAGQHSMDATQSHRVRIGDKDRHVHVRTQRGFAASSQPTCGCQQCKANTGSGTGVIVYTDANGRNSVAPPTQPFISPAIPKAAGELDGGQQLRNRAAYYLPPRQILRLKASTNFNQPIPEPSVASIQMRDTLIVDGSHLLLQPEKGAAAQNRRARQEVEVDEIRDALKRLTTEKQLR